MSRHKVLMTNVAEFDLDDISYLGRDYGDAVMTIPVGNRDYWTPANYDARDELVAPMVDAFVGDSPNAVDVYYSKVMLNTITITTYGDCAWTDDQLTRLARKIAKALAD